MNASGLPASASSSPADGGITLLLDLMEHEPALGATPQAGAGWMALAQDWSQRAASWGAGPQGAWRAW